MKSVAVLVLACGAFLTNALGVEFLWGVNGAAGAASNLYAINPTNGQVLGLIGSTGTVCLSGLAIQPGTGNLLAAQGQLSPTGASSKHLYRIDKSTGAVSVIGTLDSKYAISDLAMRADGTLFGFGIGSTVKKLLSLSTTTATPTEIGNTNNIVNVSLTFGADGTTLYLVRTNALFTVNTSTGVMSGLTALNGATTQIDNMLATSSAGVIYGALRSGGGTNLYRIDPSTATTTLVGTASGVALSGIAFDNAAAPKIAITGKKKVRTKKPTVVIKGTATSLLPLTVSAKGVKPVSVKAGKWQARVKLKKGKNVVKLTCKDGFGQSAKATVTIIRD